MTERLRRSRRLSDAEIELWLAVTQTVVARQGAVLPEAKPAAVRPTSPPPEQATPPAQTAGAPVPRPVVRQPPQLAPFEKRYRRQVTRGQVAIDAAIDLHGLTQAGAHDALHAFLRAAQQAGGRLVLVVTGKGRARTALMPGAFDREPGVLRRAVPGWLREPRLRGIVLGFEEAGLPHGGVGALYIRLRKRAS